jgi:HNH endonuclease
MGVTEKECTACLLVKPASDFAHCARGPGGLQWKCKACSAAYYQENREHKKAYGAAYHQANRERINSRHVIVYQENIEDRKAQWKKRYEATKEYESERKRIYYLAKKDEINARTAEYRRKNPELYRAAASRRRGNSSAGMSKLDKQISAEYRKAIASDPCFYCGKQGEHDEHYISVVNGGTDHWWNLVRSCANCNYRKATMNGDEFIHLCTSPES